MKVMLQKKKKKTNSSSTYRKFYFQTLGHVWFCEYTCEVFHIAKTQEEWGVYIILLGSNP
jgi:hypothetical protein